MAVLMTAVEMVIARNILMAGSAAATKDGKAMNVPLLLRLSAMIIKITIMMASGTVRILTAVKTKFARATRLVRHLQTP